MFSLAALLAEGTQAFVRDAPGGGESGLLRGCTCLARWLPKASDLSSGVHDGTSAPGDPPFQGCLPEDSLLFWSLHRLCEPSAETRV